MPCRLACSPWFAHARTHAVPSFLPFLRRILPPFFLRAQPWVGGGLSAFQIGHAVVSGERPPVPPRDQLPGPDTAGWAGLDAYLQLMT